MSKQFDKKEIEQFQLIRVIWYSKIVLSKYLGNFTYYIWNAYFQVYVFQHSVKFRKYYINCVETFVKPYQYLMCLCAHHEVTNTYKVSTYQITTDNSV